MDVTSRTESIVMGSRCRCRETKIRYGNLVMGFLWGTRSRANSVVLVSRGLIFVIVICIFILIGGICCVLVLASQSLTGQ